MPWYKTGTVSVVQNSNAVIGTGTAFIANSRVGDGFRGPDGGWYEVVNIASDTALSISPNYQSATNAAGGYALAPLQGYVKDSADALRSLVNLYGSKMAALGTTGNYDLLPISKGGTGGDTPATARTGLGLGTAAVADLTTNYADTTPGRAMKVGCCGIGLTTAIVNVDAELPSGIYQVAATGGGTYPAGFNNGSVIVTQRNASPYRGHQILTSDPYGRMWRRANGGTWSSWIELATAGANSNITELNGLTKPITTAQGGVSDGYIDGLIPYWGSGSSITISSGAAFIQGTGKVLRLPAGVSITGIGGLNPDVFYYVYLYDNAGTPAVELSPIAPAAPFFGTARSKAGDTSRRFICAVRSGAAGTLYGFQALNGLIYYSTGTATAPFRRLSGGGSTTYASISLSTVVPPTTQTAIIRGYAATGVAAISNSVAGNTPMTQFDAGARYQIAFPTAADQSILYAMLTAGTLTLDVCGYGMDR